MTLDLWRLATDLSVENAAILIAGGDPNATDVKECQFNGETFLEKRTTGHPGFLPAFEALKNAVMKKQLKAVFAHEADKTNGYSNRISGATWAYLSCPIEDTMFSVDEHAFDYVRPPEGETVQISVEPDWSRTTVDVEDLKTWLRARGHCTGFFFPDGVTSHDSDAVTDHTHARFAPELALALSAWRGLEGQTSFKRGPKAAIEEWIEKNPQDWRGTSDLSASAKERIATVANWGKSGGAPKSGG